MENILCPILTQITLVVIHLVPFLDLVHIMPVCTKTIDIFPLLVFLQMQYGPRYNPHVGLWDGESLERLWSYLRPFHKITREMSGANREFLLSNALAYYAETIATKMRTCEIEICFCRCP